MRNFWKATVIPGLCCILAGAVLAMILVLGYKDELMAHRDEFSINAGNVFELFEVDEYNSNTRAGKHYGKGDTNASYSFEVPQGETITGINFEFAVGEVEIQNGDSMKVQVVDMFEDAITSEVKNGVWYIKDSLMESGSVHSDYSPEITITIPDRTQLEELKIHLAAGLLEAEDLAAETAFLEVDAGSMKVEELLVLKALEVQNGVGEIRVYDAKVNNITVDNGIGAISLTGAVSGENKIKCGIGEVKLTLTDRNSVDFNYTIDCGIGQVEIGEKSYQGSVESAQYDQLSADSFALECGIGHIEINIAGN